MLPFTLDDDPIRQLAVLAIVPLMLNAVAESLIYLVIPVEVTTKRILVG